MSKRADYRWRNLRTSTEGTTLRTPDCQTPGSASYDIGQMRWFWVPARADSECVLCGAGIEKGSRAAYSPTFSWVLCVGCTSDVELKPKMSRGMIEASSARDL